MKAKILKIGQIEKILDYYNLAGWEFAASGQAADYPQNTVFGHTYEELQKLSRDNMLLFRLKDELRWVAEHCPNCQGAREYTFSSRGRDNVVPCVRCEPVYQMLEPLEAVLGVLPGED